MKRLLFSAMVISLSVSYSWGFNETGTGARAFSLANNHTALSAGIADLYWNPGALAFSVSREMQLSLYGIRTGSTSRFFGTTETEKLERFRFGSAGVSYAIPTRTGGMSMAFSWSNPIILDDAFAFNGGYVIDDTTTLINDRISRTSGNLDFWTSGFGIQIAENLGLGVSLSLVTGKSSTSSILDKSVEYPGDSFSRFDNYRTKGRYLGYDARVGLFYKKDNLTTGIRLVFPRYLHLTEHVNGYFKNSSIDVVEESNLYTSYSGAWGVSAELPYVTISAELRSTLPYNYRFPVETIPDDCQAGYFKTGGGIGIEIPVPALPAILRTGYSCDEPDLHPWMFDFIEDGDRSDDNISFDWTDDEIEVSRLHHRFSGGIGFTSSTTSFDIAYAFSTWGFTSQKHLRQTYHEHRLLTSLAIRF